MKSKKLSMIMAIFLLSICLCSCGNAQPTIVTIKGTQIDLSEDTSLVVSKFEQAGFASYDYTKRKIVANDGVTLSKPENIVMSNFVIVRKGIYDFKGDDPSNYVGFREYGFGKQYCGEASVMGYNNDASFDKAIQDGFMDDGKYAVKIFADGEEVNINSYKAMAKEYVTTMATSSDSYQIFIDKGWISEIDETNSLFSGYGLVNNIMYENFTMLLNYDNKAGYKFWAENFNETNENQPAMINSFMTLLAASDMGKKYANGKIKSLVAVLIPKNPETEQLYISVACPGTEAAEWGK